MSYIIACNSRNNNDVLFMVDRSKQHKSFWSYKLDDALKLKSLEIAKQKVAKLKYNSPRVITFEDAKELERLNIIDKINFCEDPGDDEYWNGKDYK